MVMLSPPLECCLAASPSDWGSDVGDDEYLTIVPTLEPDAHQKNQDDEVLHVADEILHGRVSRVVVVITTLLTIEDSSRRVNLSSRFLLRKI